MPPIQFEPTPNPNAIKCVVDPASIEPDPTRPGLGIRSYFNAEAAREADDPLAHALFAIPGVANLLIHTAFITVGKSPDAKWPAIKPKVKAVLKSASEPGSKGTPDA